MAARSKAWICARTLPRIVVSNPARAMDVSCECCVLSGRGLCDGPVPRPEGKGKANPLQAWSGPEGSRKLRFPDYMTTAQNGGKVVSLTHRPPLPPGNAPGTHFC